MGPLALLGGEVGRGRRRWNSARDRQKHGERGEDRRASENLIGSACEGLERQERAPALLGLTAENDDESLDPAALLVGQVAGGLDQQRHRPALVRPRRRCLTEAARDPDERL